MPAMKTTPAHIRFLFGNLRHWNAQWPAEEREFAAGCAVVAAVRNIECPLILTILRLRSENTSNRRNPCDEVGALDTRVPGSSRSRRLSGHWLGKGHSQGSCLFLNSSTSPRTMCRERWAVLRHCLGLTETGVPCPKPRARPAAGAHRGNRCIDTGPPRLPAGSATVIDRQLKFGRNSR